RAAPAAGSARPAATTTAAAAAARARRRRRRGARTPSSRPRSRTWSGRCCGPSLASPARARGTGPSTVNVSPTPRRQPAGSRSQPAAPAPFPTRAPAAAPPATACPGARTTDGGITDTRGPMPPPPPPRRMRPRNGRRGARRWRRLPPWSYRT
ncbi:unnamed protein product, partial [Ectocarpus sp. 8 AP-2014]